MATLTLKNVPDDLYQRLKAQAVAHRRSLNQEAIECLASANPQPRTPAQQAAAFARLEAFHERQSSEGIWIEHENVKAMIEEGRP